MKISSMFDVSALLMAVLVFSTPFMSFAQQNAEVPASKATTAPNTLSRETLLAIVRKAKADAQRDVNEVIWIARGCLGGTIGGFGILFGAVGYYGFLGPGPEPEFCALGG